MTVKDRRALAELFKVLGDPTRLALLDYLAAGGEAGTPALMAATGGSASLMTHHLGVLAQAGVVGVEQRGAAKFYRLAPATPAAARLARLALDLMAADGPPGSGRFTGDAAEGAAWTKAFGAAAEPEKPAPKRRGKK